MQRIADIGYDPRRGITILEILIVLTIVALLAAVVGPRLIGYLGHAKSEAARLQLKQIDSAVRLFYLDTGRFPTEIEGLNILVQEPPGMPGWRGPYLSSSSALTDPWTRTYLYSQTGNNFTLRSLGRDGREGGSGEDADLSN